MWNNQTIFSAGDLLDDETWYKFMKREYSIYDDESADEAIRDRKQHIRSCVDRLLNEMSMIDYLGKNLIASMPERPTKTRQDDDRER